MFSGATDYSMQIQAPYDLYYNDTEGVCGNMNDNPNDDPTCPNGGSIDDCWERHHGGSTTTQSPLTSPASPPTTTSSHQACTPEKQAIVNQECSIINDTTGPFSVCAMEDKSLADNYYQNCIFDLCYANNLTDICAILQSYADACMQDLPGTIIQWRSENLCRKSIWSWKIYSIF